MFQITWNPREDDITSNMEMRLLSPTETGTETSKVVSCNAMGILHRNGKASFQDQSYSGSKMMPPLSNITMTMKKDINLQYVIGYIVRHKRIVSSHFIKYTGTSMTTTKNALHQ